MADFANSVDPDKAAHNFSSDYREVVFESLIRSSLDKTFFFENYQT